MNNIRDYKPFYEAIQSKLQTNCENDSESKSDTSDTNTLESYQTINGLHEFEIIWPHMYNNINSSMKDFLLQIDQYYLIVRRICQYLPFYHLVMLQQVMGPRVMNWTKVALAEIQSRNTLFNWQTAAIDYKLLAINCCKMKLIYSENIFNTNFVSGLTFHDMRLKLNGKVLVSTPQIKRREMKSFLEFLHDDAVLNMNIVNVCLGVQNVQVFNPHLPGVDCGGAFSSLLLPYIPNMSIEQFNFSSKPKEVLNGIVAEGEQLECLLIFTKCLRPSNLILKLLEYIQTIQCKNIPIAGAIVWSLKMQSLSKTQITFGSTDMYCIAFKSRPESGETFSTASIIIPEDEIFEDKVIEFKQNLQLRQEDFLLSFICYAKDSKDIEADILMKHFDCPITQMEVNGELGHSVYTKNQRENINLRGLYKEGIFDFHHGYTTILVYIGWGNLRTDRCKK